MTSTSQSSTSTITVNLRQNYDTSKAAAEINIKVNSVLNQLPIGSLQPTITVKVGQTTDAMYIGFSQQHPRRQPDHRLPDPRGPADSSRRWRACKRPRSSAAKHSRCARGSIRRSLPPTALTATDMSTALANNDYISAVGNTKGQMVQVTLTSTTNLHSLEEFRNLVVKQINGSNIRLSDVAEVSLGADSYEAKVAVDGKTGVFIGIQIAPTANLLTRHQGRAERHSPRSRRSCRKAWRPASSTIRPTS